VLSIVHSFELGDQILIQDLIQKLSAREKYVLRSVNPTDTDPLTEDLKKYNEECLSIADEVLKKIDWTKY
jgi:hypothetical protein